MAELTELQQTPAVIVSPVVIAPVVRRVSVVATNAAHLFAALIFAAVGVCAIVGLTQGDWYSVEASVAPSTITTQYFGLRFQYICNGAATPIVGIPGQFAPANPCTAGTYTSLRKAADVANDNSQRDAYDQLIGAGGIITALLAVLIVVCVLGFKSNIFALRGRYSFGWKPHRFLLSRVLIIIALILEFLVLIFWITIFPYAYFQNYENTFPNNFIFYHTLGTGFAIQIAGFLLALYGCFRHNPRTPMIVVNEPVAVV